MKDTDEYKAMYDRHLKEHQKDNETRRLVLLPNPDPKRHLQPDEKHKRSIAGGEVLTQAEIERAAHASAEREYARKMTPAPEWIEPGPPRGPETAGGDPKEKQTRRWQISKRPPGDRGGRER